MPDNQEEEILTPAQRNALIDAATIVLDEAFYDLADVIKGKAIDETIIFDEYLPSQFRHHYNVLFLKKFLVCLVRVADQLANWDGEIIPACTAECLALRAIVKRAEALLDLDGVEEETCLDLFVDVAFPDMDVELLFDQAEKLGIFGSYVRGEQNSNSDVDILVSFKELVGLLKFVALKHQLGELIGKDVDLVMKSALQPGIGKRILKEVIYV